jgi:hypothetical protein
MLAATISEGINQKLARRFLQSRLRLFMGQLPFPIPNLRQVLAVLVDALLVFDEPPLIVRMLGLAGFLDDSFLILQYASPYTTLVKSI